MRARAWAWWALLVAAAVGARELDPATCAPRFDVQRDKIIRTEESRGMGARYLSELDVGTRHECLRLCCETDACDVFVYEEKGVGSCYLFKCGPPEDFRCKFTAHGNFSSGVMAVSRQLAELQDQELLTHHEQELASLRSGTSSTPRSTTSATAAPPPPPPPDAIPPHDVTYKRRCSRYQFECRRGGDCIAVYNACDGVPQCADGSDEAPELGCPPAAPAPPRAPPAAAPAPPPQPPLPPQLQTRYNLPQESSEGADGVGPEGAAMGERWPHRLAQAQAQPPHRYNDGGPSSHIFSHKGGLLQEVDPAQYPPFDPPWPRAPWLHQNSGIDSMSGERGWMGGAGAAAGGGYARADWPEPETRRTWPVPAPAPAPAPAPQPRPEPELPVYIPPKTMPEVPMAYSSRQQTLRDSPKKGFELNKPEPTEPPQTPRPSAERPPPAESAPDQKAVGTKSSVPGYPVLSGEKKVSAEAHQHYPVADEHDGLSEHPPAAVLLLIIGVLMTVAMGGMLGCRARAARRRLRRGKAPFAHDADYLVNGMYL